MHATNPCMEIPIANLATYNYLSQVCQSIADRIDEERHVQLVAKFHATRNTPGEYVVTLDGMLALMGMTGLFPRYQHDPDSWKRIYHEKYTVSLKEPLMSCEPSPSFPVTNPPLTIERRGGVPYLNGRPISHNETPTFMWNSGYCHFTYQGHTYSCRHLTNGTPVTEKNPPTYNLILPPSITLDGYATPNWVQNSQDFKIFNGGRTFSVFGRTYTASPLTSPKLRDATFTLDPLPLTPEAPLSIAGIVEEGSDYACLPTSIRNDPTFCVVVPTPPTHGITEHLAPDARPFRFNYRCYEYSRPQYSDRWVRGPIIPPPTPVFPPVAPFTITLRYGEVPPEIREDPSYTILEPNNFRTPSCPLAFSYRGYDYHREAYHTTFNRGLPSHLRIPKEGAPNRLTPEQACTEAVRKDPTFLVVSGASPTNPLFMETFQFRGFIYRRDSSCNAFVKDKPVVPPGHLTLGVFTPTPTSVVVWTLENTLPNASDMPKVVLRDGTRLTLLSDSFATRLNYMRPSDFYLQHPAVRSSSHSWNHNFDTTQERNTYISNLSDAVLAINKAMNPTSGNYEIVSGKGPIAVYGHDASFHLRNLVR